MIAPPPEEPEIEDSPTLLSIENYVNDIINKVLTDAKIAIKAENPTADIQHLIFQNPVDKSIIHHFSRTDTKEKILGVLWDQYRKPHLLI